MRPRIRTARDRATRLFDALRRARSIVGYAPVPPYLLSVPARLTLGFYSGFGYPYRYGYPAIYGYPYGSYGYPLPPRRTSQRFTGYAYGGVRIQGAPGKRASVRRRLQSASSTISTACCSI
jgi:hypothetical protein